MYISQSGQGSVFDLCNHILGSQDDEFIRISKLVADKLAHSQTSQKIPGGILVVFDGLIGVQQNRVLGIIKAEIHEGFELKTNQHQLLLTFISNLLLTPTQKLYKIGLFIESDQTEPVPQRTPDSYEIIIYDHNLMNKTEASQAAKYFYDSFLGCAFSPSDKKLTRDFFYNTREYIETLPIGDEEKLDLHNGLYSYLKVSQSNVVETRAFSEEYLEPRFQDGYRQHMSNKNIPETAITKDLTYLKNKLRRKQIHFSSDVRIIAPSEHFLDLVNIRGSEDGKTIVAIQGTIEKTE
jgi:hypothetical protein